MAYLRPYRGLEERLEALVFLINFYQYEELPMKFTKISQLQRTITLMQDNKVTKRVQYPNAFKKMSVEFVEAERAKAEAGVSDEYVYQGKFSLSAICKELGMVNKSGINRGNGAPRLVSRWIENYDKYEGIDVATDKGHSCSVTQHASVNYLHAKQTVVGTMAREVNALISLRKELKQAYIKAA